MNVIRMVKLFGWEHKISEQLFEKRNEELKFVRRLSILQLMNSVSKLVGSVPLQLFRYLRYLPPSYLIPLMTVLVSYGTYVSCDSRFRRLKTTDRSVDSYHEGNSDCIQSVCVYGQFV